MPKITIRPVIDGGTPLVRLSHGKTASLLTPMQAREMGATLISASQVSMYEAGLIEVMVAGNQGPNERAQVIKGVRRAVAARSNRRN